MDASDYEKLGEFYLGRALSAAAEPTSTAPLLYDSRDLTTHAVCMGMTGSGKTGLCLALLEEAAIDGIPAIAIDPKGDIPRRVQFQFFRCAVHLPLQSGACMLFQGFVRGGMPCIEIVAFMFGRFATSMAAPPPHEKPIENSREISSLPASGPAAEF